MKLKVLLVLVLCNSVSFISCQGNKLPAYVEENRELLKEFFLYKCLEKGLRQEGFEIGEYDHSSGAYIDISSYNALAYRQVDSLANWFVGTIPYSTVENKTRRGLIILSIEYFKSKELDNFIKGLDEYIYLHNR